MLTIFLEKSLNVLETLIYEWNFSLPFKSQGNGGTLSSKKLIFFIQEHVIVIINIQNACAILDEPIKMACHQQNNKILFTYLPT